MPEDRSPGMLLWLTWQRVPVRELRIDHPARETRILLGFALLYVGLSAATGLLIRAYPLPILGASKFNQDFWYAVVFKISALLVLPAVVFLRAGYRARDLLLDFRPSPKALLGLLVIFAAGFSLNLGHIARIEAAAEQMPLASILPRLALGIVLPLLVAGIPEEFVYRGLLQTRLEATAGRPAAILLTALLFTAWHLPTRFLLSTGVEGTAGDFGSVLVGTGLPVFVVGLVLGLLWDRYRRLLPLIFAHWGIDILPTVSSFFGISF